MRSSVLVGGLLSGLAAIVALAGVAVAQDLIELPDTYDVVPHDVVFGCTLDAQQASVCVDTNGVAPRGASVTTRATTPVTAAVWFPTNVESLRFGSTFYGADTNGHLRADIADRNRDGVPDGVRASPTIGFQLLGARRVSEDVFVGDVSGDNVPEVPDVSRITGIEVPPITRGRILIGTPLPDAPFVEVEFSDGVPTAHVHVGMVHLPPDLPA